MVSGWSKLSMVSPAMHSIIFQMDARTCLTFWFGGPHGDQPESWLGRSANAEAVHVKCMICLIKADLTQEMRMSIKHKTPVRGPIPHWKIFWSCLITWRRCTATFLPADNENHTHPSVSSLRLSCIVKSARYLLVLFLCVSCQSSKPVKYVPESLWRNVNFTHPFWFECNQTWIWLGLHNKERTVTT